MSKVALITDTHFGVRNDNSMFLENALRFLRDDFFPYLRENNIKTIIHMGDLLDRRKYVNFNTLKNVREHFLNVCQREEISLYIIPGNHDIYFKNTSRIISFVELFDATDTKAFSHLHVVYANEIVEILGKQCMFIPWILAETQDETIDFLNIHSADYVFGHFEVICPLTQEATLDPNLFNRFENVFSGHYHNQKQIGKIHFLGSPFQMTMNDLGSEKGFLVIDFETGEKTFIQNEHRMFNYIVYDDEKTSMNDLLNTDCSSFTGTMVKIIVQKKTNPYIFEKFLELISNVEPMGIQIVDNQEMYSSGSEETVEDNNIGTLDVLKNYVDGMQYEDDIKQELKTLIDDLYQRANSLESASE